MAELLAFFKTHNRYFREIGDKKFSEERVNLKAEKFSEVRQNDQAVLEFGRMDFIDLFINVP